MWFARSGWTRHTRRRLNVPCRHHADTGVQRDSWSICPMRAGGARRHGVGPPQYALGFVASTVGAAADEAAEEMRAARGHAPVVPKTSTPRKRLKAASAIRDARCHAQRGRSWRETRLGGLTVEPHIGKPGITIHGRAAWRPRVTDDDSSWRQVRPNHGGMTMSRVMILVGPCSLALLFTLGCGPNLHVLRERDQGVPFDYCRAGANGGLDVVVSNNGSRAVAATTHTKITWQTGETKVLSTPPIAAGGSVVVGPFLVPMPCTRTGDCEFDISVDDDNAVSESNESDNVVHGLCPN